MSHTSPQVSNSKPRIEYVDLAKGICIMMVVFLHCSMAFNLRYPLYDECSAFRMPLYFCLSGLFFKEYGGFGDFMLRKVNKLLIPFVTFYALANLAIPIVAVVLDLDFILHDNPFGDFYETLRTGNIIRNTPIWFLWCLFVMNALFYLVHLTARKVMPSHATLLMTCIVIAIGYAGYSGCHTDNWRSNYLYLGTALTAMPFFAAGYIVRLQTDWLTRSHPVWVLLVAFMAGMAIVGLFARWASYLNNDYDGSYTSVVGCGLAGTAAILALTKAIGHLPLISYWGRYSIIILCMHKTLLNGLQKITSRLTGETWTSVMICFVVLMLSFLVIIPLMKRWLPWIVAQRDVFPPARPT